MRKTLSASTGQRGFRSLRVLVADDSRVERKVVASILERRGHRVTVAADGREALTLFHQNSFDAAVLDLQMPGIDGEALAVLLRERLRSLESPESEAAPAFRIIAVSGTLPEQDGQAIDRYLAKPIDPDQLAAAIEGQPELESELPAAGGEEVLGGERVVFDLGEALARARGKRPLLAELVRIFLEDAVVQMLALKAALDAADLDRIERSAHRLKGSAMNVSAQLTADIAQQIEQSARAGQAPDARTLWEKFEVEVSRARKALAGFLAQNGGPGATAGFGLAKGAAVPHISSHAFLRSFRFPSFFAMSIPGAVAGTPPLNILLIEDNPGDALLLKETLQESGLAFELFHVEQLQDGVERAQRQTFDLVMLDLSLPDSTGTATIARAGKAFWKTPVIVLTALDDDQMGLKSLQFGAQDYLVKSQVTAPLLLRSLRYAKERHREREALLRASLIDDLTGLYNRRGFVNVGTEELAAAAARGRELLVVFADLDGLKQINDLHGHAAGDWAISKTAEVLKANFSPDDTVGRIGGDEFAAICPNPAPGAEEQLRDTLAVALRQAAAEFGRPYTLAVTLGFHRPAKGEATDLDGILVRADQALYQAKRARPGAQIQG